MEKKYKKLIYDRIIVTVLLLLFQIFWFAILIFKLYTRSIYITYGVSLLGFACVLYIINKQSNPSFKIGWILLIAFLPVFGVLFYVLFGQNKPTKKMRFKINESKRKIIGDILQDESAEKALRNESQRAANTSQYIYNASNYPVYKNTDVKYYSIGEDMFSSMVEDLKSAEHFIFIEYFIISEGIMWNTILDILVEKAKQGVDVRIIFDDMGNIALLPPKYEKTLEALNENIKCFAFNSVVPLMAMRMNNRDHRKIMVIDGNIAYNGGINLADEYINHNSPYGHWKDTGVRLCGSAVWSFTAMFLEMWNAYYKTDTDISKFRPSLNAIPKDAQGYIQPYSDTPVDNEPLGENVYIELLSRANRYAYIFTPYLILDNELRAAICLASKRGVDVRIVTPGIPDKKIVYRLTRANYKDLMDNGVKIYEYTPGFLHAKCMVCDDEVAVVGSINMDYRSLYLHFECATYMYKCPAVLDVKKDILLTIEKSHKVSIDDLKKNIFARIFDSVLRVFEPLF